MSKTASIIHFKHGELFFLWQKSLSLFQFNNHASNWVSSIKGINRNESILCVYAIYLSKIHYLEELMYMSLEGWVRTEVKTPEFFQLYIWDNCWDCPASVRIISSIEETILLAGNKAGHWYLLTALHTKQFPCRHGFQSYWAHFKHGRRTEFLLQLLQNMLIKDTVILTIPVDKSSR